MIKLVQRMHVSASFTFRFFQFPKSPQNLFVRIDRKDVTHLAVAISEDNKFTTKVTLNYLNAAAFFESCGRFSFSHWLDELPSETSETAA